MNIFAVSRDPVRAAQCQLDKHIVKMPLETGQLLSTTINELTGQKHPFLYKTTHLNHPSAVWARASYQNFRWLVEHFRALAAEYRLRYGRQHATFLRLDCHLDNISPSIFPKRAICPVFPAMKPEFHVNPGKTWDEVEYLYRRYYCLAKQDFAVWSHRQPPEWYARYFEKRGYELTEIRPNVYAMRK